MHLFIITGIDPTNETVSVYEANVNSLDTSAKHVVLYHTYSYMEFFNRYSKSDTGKLKNAITITTCCNPFQFMHSDGTIGINTNLSYYEGRY